MEIGSGPDRRLGPVPFSTEWIVDPPPPAPPRRLPVSLAWLPPVLPSWFPSERALTAALVFILVITTTAFTAEGPPPRQIAAPAGGLAQTNGESNQPPPTEDLRMPFTAPRDEATVTPEPDAPDAEGTIASDEDGDLTVIEDESVASAEQATDSGGETPGSESDDATEAISNEGDLAITTETPVQGDPSVAAATTGGASSADTSGYLLPHHRIVAYYGHPHDSNMGILGEYPKEELYEKLMVQVRAWEEADPSRPVIPAFEIIATVAQQDPMSDGTYLLDTDWETIRSYIDFAAEHDMLIFLDVQVGRRGVQAEVERLLPLLEYPHVHLAIDPEFAMEEGEQPGVHIGQVDASEITWVQNLLVDFAAEHGLPPKILLIHQFHYTMITSKSQLAPVPGVQLIIHADGHGPPEMKKDTYWVTNSESPIEFAGFKIFYPQPNWAPDTPLMQPEDIMELDPVPDIVTYQ